jgi:hypothetical protein
MGASFSRNVEMQDVLAGSPQSTPIEVSSRDLNQDDRCTSWAERDFAGPEPGGLVKPYLLALPPCESFVAVGHWYGLLKISTHGEHVVRTNYCSAGSGSSRQANMPKDYYSASSINRVHQKSSTISAYSKSDSPVDAVQQIVPFAPGFADGPFSSGMAATIPPPMFRDLKSGSFCKDIRETHRLFIADGMNRMFLYRLLCIVCVLCVRACVCV